MIRMKKKKRIIYIAQFVICQLRECSFSVKHAIMPSMSIILRNGLQRMKSVLLSTVNVVVITTSLYYAIVSFLQLRREVLVLFKIKRITLMNKQHSFYTDQPDLHQITEQIASTRSLTHDIRHKLLQRGSSPATSQDQFPCFFWSTRNDQKLYPGKQ